MRLVTIEQFDSQYRAQNGLIEIGELKSQKMRHEEYAGAVPVRTTEKDLESATRNELIYNAGFQGANLLVDVKKTMTSGILGAECFSSGQAYFAPELLDGQIVLAAVLENHYLEGLEKAVNLVKIGDFEDMTTVNCSSPFVGVSENDLFVGYLTLKMAMAENVTRLGADYLIISLDVGEETEENCGYASTVAVVKGAAYKIAGPKNH